MNEKKIPGTPDQCADFLLDQVGKENLDFSKLELSPKIFDLNDQKTKYGEFYDEKKPISCKQNDKNSPLLLYAHVLRDVSVDNQNRIKNDEIFKEKDSIYIFGAPSGCGKTRRLMQIACNSGRFCTYITCCGEKNRSYDGEMDHTFGSLTNKFENLETENMKIQDRSSFAVVETHKYILARILCFIFLWKKRGNLSPKEYFLFQVNSNAKKVMKFVFKTIWTKIDTYEFKSCSWKEIFEAIVCKELKNHVILIDEISSLLKRDKTKFSKKMNEEFVERPVFYPFVDSLGSIALMDGIESVVLAGTTLSYSLVDKGVSALGKYEALKKNPITNFPLLENVKEYYGNNLNLDDISEDFFTKTHNNEDYEKWKTALQKIVAKLDGKNNRKLVENLLELVTKSFSRFKECFKHSWQRLFSCRYRLPALSIQLIPTVIQSAKDSGVDLSKEDVLTCSMLMAITKMKGDLEKEICNTTQEKIRVILAILQVLTGVGGTKIKFSVRKKKKKNQKDTSIDLVPVGIAFFDQKTETWRIDELFVFQALEEISLTDLKIQNNTNVHKIEGSDCKFFLAAFDPDQDKAIGSSFEKVFVNWICRRADGQMFRKYFGISNEENIPKNDFRITFSSDYLGRTVNNLEIVLNNPGEFFRMTTFGKWDAVCCLKNGLDVILIIVAFKYSSNVVSSREKRKNVIQSGCWTPYMSVEEKKEKSTSGKTKKEKKKVEYSVENNEKIDAKNEEEKDENRSDIVVFEENNEEKVEKNIELTVKELKSVSKIRKKFAQDFKNVTCAVRICVELDKRRQSCDTKFDPVKYEDMKTYVSDMKVHKNYREKLLFWNGDRLNEDVIGVNGKRVVEVLRNIRIEKPSSGNMKDEDELEVCNLGCTVENLSEIYSILQGIFFIITLK